MIEINVEDQKKAVFDLNGIAPFDEKMTFYYDESGNCRKFSLTETGFNNTDALKGDFVLAGIAYEGESFNIDVSTLYTALEYKEGQKELKFKHLYHNSNDFLSFIESKRATGFLNWLANSGLYIHYSTLNNLFHSLVDIVDSLLETYPQYIMYSWEIKNALYDFVIGHQDEVVSIFVKYTYPDVKDVYSFCGELCELIQTYNTYNNDDDYYPGFFLELFRQMIKMAGKLGKMVFIQDNEPGVLVAEYYLFYLERCVIFSKSNHIFDEEPTVEKKLSNILLYENGESVNNWQFVKSHENIYIQVSDMIAGLLRRLFMFLDDNSIERIHTISLSLNDIQIANFIILWTLISQSDVKSQLLLKNANPPKKVKERMMKLQMLGIANNREGGAQR